MDDRRDTINGIKVRWLPYQIYKIKWLTMNFDGFLSPLLKSPRKNQYVTLKKIN